MSCFMFQSQCFSGSKFKDSFGSVFKYLFDICLPSAGATGLYIPQTKYSEMVYVGQPAGTQILQVHALLDSDSERQHFFLCPPKHSPTSYYSWFHMDINTGILSLNKTLEESDFALLGEIGTAIFNAHENS